MALREETKSRKDFKSTLTDILPKIFKTKDDAEWAFKLLKSTTKLLGIEDYKDIRFGVMVKQDDPTLRFYFAKWMFLGFDNSKYYTSCQVEIVLQKELDGKNDNYIYRNLDQYDNEPDIKIYKMPINKLKDNGTRLCKNYKNTIGYIRSTYPDPDIPKPNNIKKRHLEVHIAHNYVIINDLANLKELDKLLQGFNGETKYPEYTLAKCAQDTNFKENILNKWIKVINKKGQVIIYGPPGTGKTFIAEHLAKHLTGGSDGFFELVQFHPSYAYEDFIQGIRPKARDDGGLDYPIVPGRFLEFCRQAKSCEGICVLIIDEINRANLSRVFGELMYLLEYRNQKIPLAGGNYLHIPSNVRIIGTMNTADRSIALVDHALRRRFSFLPLYPNYEIMRKYHQETNFPVEKLIKILKQLNAQIGDQHYEVGISFFLCKELVEDIENIWVLEIEPYLEEYFFDQMDKVEQFRWDKIQENIGI